MYHRRRSLPFRLIVCRDDVVPGFSLFSPWLVLSLTSF